MFLVLEPALNVKSPHTQMDIFKNQLYFCLNNPYFTSSQLYKCKFHFDIIFLFSLCAL